MQSASSKTTSPMLFAPRSYTRNYAPIERCAPALRNLPTLNAMSVLTDLLWEHFGHDEHQAIDRGGISWVGFYGSGTAHNTPANEMHLLVRRDKPACSPIGLFGACGQSLTRKSILVIRDVATLGAGYIACDPRDQSELVLPCINSDGQTTAVLDIDSFAPGAFNLYDALMLAHIMHQAGLTNRVLTSSDVELI